MFYLDKTPSGRMKPNWRYYLLVMHHDYGKKIRQHGKKLNIKGRVKPR